MKVKTVNPSIVGDFNCTSDQSIGPCVTAQMHIGTIVEIEWSHVFFFLKQHGYWKTSNVKSN